MTEYIDLYDAGTLTFSDGEKVLSNTSLLMRALRYLPHTGARLMMIAAEKDLIKGGLMHEGITSTFLGMRGIPALAEELAVQKAISVLRFTGGKLHFSLVSSAKTAEMIADAKREGLDVTADTAFYHLDLTDEALIDFDTNLKVFPPLRAEEDRSALVEAVKTGVIDAVVSNHSAQDTESKRLEFDMAENGMLGLQTAFPVALRHTGMSAWVRSVTTGARKVLGLPQTEIEEGNTVSFTLFDTATEQVFDRQTNYSKSKNSPYLGNVMRGKVFAVMSEKGILSVDM
jgi:dihydroorotase